MPALDDPWVAYQFDSAVSTFGVIVENALQEQINVGDDSKPRYINKYTLQQLLTPGFCIQRDDEDSDLDLAGVDGIQFDEVGP